MNVYSDMILRTFRNEYVRKQLHHLSSDSVCIIYVLSNVTNMNASNILYQFPRELITLCSPLPEGISNT